MRFSAAHRVTTHLSVLFAHLTLLLSGELSFWVGLIALASVVASWSWEPRRGSSTAGRLANAAGLLALVVVAVEAVQGAAQRDAENLLLQPFAHFLLLFQSSRLFTRRQSRDYLQIYIVGFFELITATALNEDLSYALCFIGYAVSVTWALILFQLRREMEENYLLRHSDDASSEKVEVDRILNSKRIISREFLAVTGALSLVVVVVGVLLSLLLPRFDGGPPSARGRRQQMIGFSDGVALGGFGRLREDFRVAMRVQPLSGALPGPLYLRGLAFDLYDGRSWSRSGGAWEALPLLGPVSLAAAPLTEERLSISLEPLEPPVLFLPDRAAQLSFPGRVPGLLARDPFGNYSVDALHHGGLRYEVALRGEAPADTSAEIPAEVRAHYLQLPSLEDGVPRLARQITEGASSPEEKARRIEAYLRAEYEYSLELSRDETRAPLEDFLFVQRRGHCEYFATAMAILLRTQGVPARVVNGFYGGEWNEFGEYLAIRRGDAHAWVEVFLPGHGWTRFDPTPAAPVVRGWSGALERWYDAWRRWWFGSVVAYDLSTQRDVFSWMRGVLLPWVGAVLGLLLGGGALWAVGSWLRRRAARPAAPTVVGVAPVAEDRPREAGERKRALRLYRRALDLMAKRGYLRAPSMTAREYVEKLRAQDVAGHELLAELTRLYEGTRFGEPAGDPALETLALRLKSLEKNR